jgi:hypothetical protein
LQTETQAQRVVAKFGGIEKLIEGTVHPYKRVWNWLNAGTIPQRWWPQLLEEARALRVELQPSDFVAHLEEPAGAPESIRKAG